MSAPTHNPSGSLLSSPEAPAISAIGLWHRFDSRIVLADVHLDVPRGELFGLVGPNGSGKTTLLRILATHLEPWMGQVRVHGHQLGLEPESIRRLVGYVPEDEAGLCPELTVLETLCFFAAAREKRDPASLEAVLDATGLSPLRSEPVGPLSRAERKRLLLARALLHDPQVLIVDDPFVDLDPKNRAALVELFLHLQNRNKTVVLASRLPGELESLCGSLGILTAQGKVGTTRGRGVAPEHRPALVPMVADAAPRPLAVTPERWGRMPILTREWLVLLRRRRVLLLWSGSAILATLLCGAVAGLFRGTTPAPRIGAVLHQIFFSALLCLLAWLSPALAALRMNTERRAGSWEALTSTELGPTQVIKQNVLARWMELCTYGLVLVPVSLLSTLLGGVRVSEILLTWLLLALLAGPLLTLGTYLGARSEHPAAAVAKSILLGVVGSLVIGLGMGVGLSFPAHERSAAVLRGGPFWLPTATVSAPFDWTSVVGLLILPGLLILGSGWFFYELAKAAATPERDDNSRGLRTWLLIGPLALALCASLWAMGIPAKASVIARFTLVGLEQLFLAMAVVLQAEPLWPSRRWQWRFEQHKIQGCPILRPGLLPAMGLLLGVALPALGAPVVASLLLDWALTGLVPGTEGAGLLLMGVTGFAFLVLVVGIAAAIRTQVARVPLARLLTLSSVFLLIAVPHLLLSAARAGGLESVHLDWLSALSPLHPFALQQALRAHASLGDPAVRMGLFAAGTWAMSGVGLLFGSALVVRGRVRQRDQLEGPRERTGSDRAAEPDPSESKPGAPRPLQDPDYAPSSSREP